MNMETIAMAIEKLTELIGDPDPYSDVVVPENLYWNDEPIEFQPAGQLVGCGCKSPSANGTVYLSGPISGESYDDARYGWRKYVADRLTPGIKALSPMRHEGHLAEIKGPLENQYPDHFFSGKRIIVEKDKLDIERCDIMLVNLLGATKRVSIGTAVEIGIAMTLGKKVILVIEESGNVHDHPFITEPASLRVSSLDDAVYAINMLCSEGI
jgi:nucleoside 2-deoxyribosyltransferase